LGASPAGCRAPALAPPPRRAHTLLLRAPPLLSPPSPPLSIAVADPAYGFKDERKRSSVDLKDKYRNMQKAFR
jgi:hypothetical protein